MAISAGLRKGMRFGAAMEREQSVSKHLPYLRHVDDTTIKATDGVFMSVIKFDGFCFQTADQADVNQRLAFRNTVIKAMSDSRFAVYAHIVRRRVTAEIGGSFDNPFARLMNERYMAGFADKRMFANDLYLTVLRRQFVGKVGMAENLAAMFKSLGGVPKEDNDAEARRELREVIAGIVSGFANYGARLLSVIEDNGVVLSEPCSFLGQLLNGGAPRRRALPRMGLNQYVPTHRVTFGKKAFELIGACESDRKFGAMLSLREYPPHTGPGMLDGLLKVPHEFIVSQSFAIEDRAPVLERIKVLEKRIAASDDKGTAVEADIQIARDDLSQGEVVIGYHHLTVACLGQTLREMEQCVDLVGKEIQFTGATVSREDMNAEACFWAQLPGNLAYAARKSLVSSRNFVGFASLHNFSSGQAERNHWGPALSVLQTTSKTPYYFNLHVRDVGNFTVNGPTGSGKTTALCFLLAQALRVPRRPRIGLFDKDRGAEILIRALGGRYEVLEPGTPTGFNPLQLPGTQDDREFLKGLLAFLVRPRDGGDLTALQEKIVEEAVEAIFELPIKERRFADVQHLLRGREKAGHDDLASRFETWTRSRGWLFNNDEDIWDTGNGIFGFDLTRVLNDKDIRSAALGYIFHRLGQLLDGTPMLVFIDEGWHILEDDKFLGFLKNALKTIRKQNGAVGFGTQSAKDIVEARIAHTLLEQTSTNIFFPNPKADFASYREAFKLSAREFRWVLETPPQARQFLIKHGNDSVVATLDLADMPEFIKVLSGRVETVEECARARAKHGDNPAAWLPAFCGIELNEVAP
ncbi:type IV secretion system protein VirB4 [Rhizobiales bacterium GAS113]|nr:type IV secretion system protein VirB4 [Rhizobiales bacterium GAS113]